MSYEFVFTDIPFRQQRVRRVRRLLRISALLALGACLSWMAIASFLALWPLVWLESSGVAASLALLWLLRRNVTQFKRHVCMLAIFGFVVGIIVVEASTPGGSPVLHFYLLGLAVAAFLIFFDSPPKVPWLYVAAFFAVYVGRQFGWLTFEPILPAYAGLEEAARHVTLIAVFVILVALTVLFVKDIADAELHLAAAHTRLEVIVDNMLPEPIAARLREEGRTFADAITSATILFADVVGFTRMVAELPAERTVALLDELFSRFDDLVEAAGVEKISTNRDTYMVAGGVPLARPDHARAVAGLALRMRDAAHAMGLDLRIGINTGPVVAGVIGRKRFVYDLWGDAVNMASRMQSTGVPDGIQVTEATRHALEDDYEFESRGPVEVKGRGKVETFLLVGPGAAQRCA